MIWVEGDGGSGDGVLLVGSIFGWLLLVFWGPWRGVVWA